MLKPSQDYSVQSNPMKFSSTKQKLSRILSSTFIADSGCITVEEDKPSDQKIMGSKLTVCWAFFSLVYLSLLQSQSRVSFNRFFEEVEHY